MIELASASGSAALIGKQQSDNEMRRGSGRLQVSSVRVDRQSGENLCLSFEATNLQHSGTLEALLYVQVRDIRSQQQSSARLDQREPGGLQSK